VAIRWNISWCSYRVECKRPHDSKARIRGLLSIRGTGALPMAMLSDSEIKAGRVEYNPQ